MVANLKRHGLLVERLKASVELTVESFTPDTLECDGTLFQGHRINRLQGTYETQTRVFPRGTLFVSTAQPLGNLAVYLLEPECDDGLFAWNFFDRYLVRQWQRSLLTVPVYKLMQPAHLITTKL
ncbi:MAG: hypothetical protein GY809_27200 [Planctomycetes bacterium]|nr:hypothetical protein [Planctomycetota bacterium]